MKKVLTYYFILKSLYLFTGCKTMITPADYIEGAFIKCDTFILNCDTLFIWK